MSASSQDENRLRILIVDDNDEDREVYRRLLGTADASFDFLEAGSGEEALEVCRRERPEAMLLDYRLPDLDGVEVLSELRRDPEIRTAVVMLTGMGDESVAVAAMKAGARDYLLKGDLRRDLLARAVRWAVDRERAERALRDSEQRFRELVENMREAFWIVDADTFEILYLSPAFDSILGRPRQEARYGRPEIWVETIHPDDRGEVLERVSQLRNTTEPFQHEFRVLRSDGSPRWLWSHGFPIRDSAGRVYRIGGLIDDVTERKNLEEQLRQSQKMEAVGRLAGGVAHDFNNQLFVIRGYAEMLLRDLPPGDPLRPRAEEILRAANRSAQLTQQLLAFGRKQFLQPRPLDLNEQLRRSADLLQRTIGADVELVLDTAADLGRVRVDVNQIEHAVLNLAINARDAMPDGGTLTLGTRNVDWSEADVARPREMSPGPYVMLSVSDTGVGMDAKTQSRIFEPFFTTKEGGLGSGLGLPSVYGIVHQSGGHLRVFSEPGRGTTFEIYLPRIEAPPTQDVERPEPGAAPGGTETILLAEDESNVRRLVHDVLESAGYRVLSAANGSHALELARAHPGRIDILLTDVVMPEMPGQELAHRFRQEYPETPVVFMSGYAEHGLLEPGTLDQRTRFVSKPITVDTLLERIRAALGGKC